MNYKRFLIEYQHEGSSWGAEIQATSFDDAEQRLRALQYGAVLGEIVGTVPAVPGSGLWARFVCWWKNRGAWRRE